MKEDNLMSCLKSFWEIEEDHSPEKQEFSVDEKTLMNRTNETTSYVKGRYQVDLPWKREAPTHLNSFDQANRRLCSTIKRLNKDKELKLAYHNVMKEYADKEYISRVSSQANHEKAFYLPHFPIVRMNKETTKVRVVFDASAKVDGLSLNDCLEVGPKLQLDLMNILVCFRKKKIALVCDISQMYLQIGVLEHDRKCLRFLWQEEDETIVYQFNRLVFGLNCSPFLAQFILRLNADLHSESFPLASAVINNATYMDDSLVSVDTIEEGKALVGQLDGLLGHAGMVPCKYTSNESITLEEIETERKSQTQIGLANDPSKSISTLGINWLPESDVFQFKSNLSQTRPNTKRKILSVISKLFDPLGLIAPIVVNAKMIMQDLWLDRTGWDEEADPNLLKRIWRWLEDLTHLKLISIPRWLKFSSAEQHCLHIFSDANEKAYGAAAFLSVDTFEDKQSTLVAAKSRVAPLKSITMPRLELLAATLAVDMAERLSASLNVDSQRIYYWCDSQIVLAWIQNRSKQLKTFVANRISRIHSRSNPDQWS